MIEVEHLSKIYGSTQAIKDVTFRVEPGEILGLLGPNGAGKTTTMRILAGYLPATAGNATIAGFEVHTQPMQVRQRIGYLPESPPLYPEMTVEGYLNFVARLKGVNAGDRPQRLNAALTGCNLQDKRKVIIRKLSKGYKQRVGIAQAIVHNPPAIILDEPTVGLDPRQIIEVRNLIKSLADGDTTVILSTHILPEVSSICNRVAIIHQGEVVASGGLDNLMGQLTGGSTFDLEVAGNQAEIAAHLQNLPQIRSLEWLGHEFLPDHHHRLRISGDADQELGKAIATTLVNSGIGLYEMRRSGGNLEEVFLKLTTTELGASNLEETPLEEIPLATDLAEPEPAGDA
ncbi:MAG: ABC transporter ATP-binding protein [Aphanocapsa sp. GSE-SYN-MK-11-07L]|jgi:ABC-2 type transport system ATP-binding protein|nr:ABC transporter ATP-binding protein [Aphanocapsa sp. GSE-SYN-MK-11-07L]